MDKLIKELQEKRATYNEILKETRSLADAGENVTKRFEELDGLRQEILDLEERKLQFEKLNQLDAIEEDEEKRFSTKPSNGSNTMREITNEDPKREVRDGINAYLRHGELRESVTTINQEVIIPKDISFIPLSCTINCNNEPIKIF